MAKSKIMVDGKEFFTNKKTLMEALDEIGIEVPRLCKHEDYDSIGSCRLCLVEADGRIVTSCNTGIRDGMVVSTNSTKVINQRTENLKLILQSHEMECLSCFRNESCELQKLASDFAIKSEIIPMKKKRITDKSSHAIVRDSGKCVLCGRCIEACKRQGVNAIDFSNRGFETKVGTAYDMPIADSNCINCGQCVLHCPTGALTEKDDRFEALELIDNPNTHTVVQFAPAIRVSLSEEFGLPVKDVTKKLITALKFLGFDTVVDTSFAADLTIMEEGNELIQRFKQKKRMFTSCCPAWVRFVETQRREYINELSSAKSPHQMMGAMVKSYFAKNENIDPKKIKMVSIMPCTAKKEEKERIQLRNEGLKNVDLVLTTRELIKLLREEGIDLKELDNGKLDYFNENSSAGEIFGKSGGVMEAALRTAKFLLDGEDSEVDFKEIKNIKGYKKLDVEINGVELKIGVFNGLGNFIKHEKEVEGLDFIEVMACPGGCVGGGGQPQPHSLEHVDKRKKSLLKKDKTAKIRKSHENVDIKKLYTDFLEYPGSKIAEDYLHTRYMRK